MSVCVIVQLQLLEGQDIFHVWDSVLRVQLKLESKCVKTSTIQALEEDT